MWSPTSPRGRRGKHHRRCVPPPFANRKALRSYSVKEGFTGRKRDRAGRNQCYAQGEHVSCQTQQQKQPEQPAPEQAPSPKSGPVQRDWKAPRTKAPAPTEKAARAKASHKVVGKKIQRFAETLNEPEFAKALGPNGKSLPDSEPVDVTDGPEGALTAGVELKTMVDNANGKITMDSYAQVRKIEWERGQGAAFHTVVLDDHQVFEAFGQDPDGGPADPKNHDFSKRRILYRRGVAGSARVANLHVCKDMEELRQLMAMPEEQLPKAAQRTDAKLRVGRWKFFQDTQGKGYKNSKTGQVVRAKK